MKRPIFTALSCLLLASSGFAAESFGVVNFSECIAGSKLGKQEQASFESVKNQMTSLLQDTEKQLNEVAAKFNDPDYLDGLSPEAEEELKTKFRTLNEELNRYQNQYYQVLNQTNMRVIQTINAGINVAAEKVAKDKKLTGVINKEAFFFSSPQLDVTSFVITEMDKNFEQTAKKVETAAPAAATPAAAPAKS